MYFSENYETANLKICRYYDLKVVDIMTFKNK